jgi:hypothetical protein
MGLRETLQRLAQPDLSGDPETAAAFDLEVGPLLDSIHAWLTRDVGAPSASRTTAMLHETGYAPRAMPGLDVILDGIVVEVRPVGALVAGAKGRVDIGPVGSDEALRILLDPGDALGWHAVRPGHPGRTPFDRGVLLETLARFQKCSLADPHAP